MRLPERRRNLASGWAKRRNFVYRIGGRIGGCSQGERQAHEKRSTASAAGQMALGHGKARCPDHAALGVRLDG